MSAVAKSKRIANYNQQNKERKNKKMNKVILMGRITKEVEIRKTATETSYTNFSIAVNRKYKNEKGEYDVDFINCIAWSNTAEFISKYFGKGKMIAITGHIQCRKYVDASNITRYATEVMVEDAYFTGEKASGANNSNGFFEIVDDDNLPF